jgi:hypothetical protein
VEKNLLETKTNSFIAVPNILISSWNPIVPVSNPSDQPRFVGGGEVIGTIADPQEFFDHARTEEGKEHMQRSVEAIAAVIKVAMNNKNQADEESNPITHNNPQLEEEIPPDDYSPKTAAMPNPTIYPSDKMEELINVGSLPEHLKEEAWAML